MEITGDSIKITANPMMGFFNTMSQRGMNYQGDLKIWVETISRGALKLSQYSENLEKSLKTKV